jgi:hypothetical protein
MSGIVTNAPGACVDGSDVMGEWVGETGVARREWPGVQSISTTCRHQVETLGLMPSVMGRMSRRTIWGGQLTHPVDAALGELGETLRGEGGG